jgi:hypothetical protein
MGENLSPLGDSTFNYLTKKGKYMIKKLSWGIAIIFLIIVSIGGYFLLFKVQQKIIFINESDYTIESIEIKYCNTVLNFNDIQKGQSFSENIQAECDSAFDVKIIFSNGTTIEENNLGYITNSGGSNSIFKVTINKELNFTQEY